jgi:hypothetical protein
VQEFFVGHINFLKSLSDIFVPGIIFNPYFKEKCIMKKMMVLSGISLALVLNACQSGGSSADAKDTVLKAGPDSAANNGVLPPSASPGDANNSSLADSAYKSPDSNKTHKDTSGMVR